MREWDSCRENLSAESPTTLAVLSHLWLVSSENFATASIDARRLHANCAHVQLMSLLREAEICLANQAALKRLNAFISTPSRSAVLEGARRADALPGRGV